MQGIKTAIVVGTGAGGATIAKELQGKYQVTILEAGKEFKPLNISVNSLAKYRKTGLFFDERLVRILVPNMHVEKSQEITLARGIGLGGTTTISAGNAIRYDGSLKEIGINLDEEFDELSKELPVSTNHQKRWARPTKMLFSVFEELGLNPEPLPKFVDADKCINCGQCAVGCAKRAKWDTRYWVDDAVQNGATLVTGCKVKKLIIQDGKVTAVEGRIGARKVRYTADIIILAAGGLGTPVILSNSGIECSDTLFVDPLICVGGEIPGFHQDRQLLMPFVSQQDGYILSPYMDYLSQFFDKRWRKPMDSIVSIMIKMADEEIGTINGKKIDKKMTEKDNARLNEAIQKGHEILTRLGVPKEKQFVGKLGGGHPSGMLPLTEQEKDTLHSPILPDNLYVADATILPKAMGNPPILTIMALAKRIAKLV